ncbi:Rho termination factor, N-terminal domain [Popillia japonica]|uniref:Rho termination factor, N-terminal domain n=1 Tax=Popillia japonica TaxID=7064 RepID=A0AAW1JFI8_POPJA
MANLKELRTIARNLNITKIHKLKKDQLIAAINKVRHDNPIIKTIKPTLKNLEKVLRKTYTVEEFHNIKKEQINDTLTRLIDGNKNLILKITVKELKRLAKGRIAKYYNLNKESLIERISQTYPDLLNDYYKKDINKALRTIYSSEDIKKLNDYYKKDINKALRTIYSSEDIKKAKEDDWINKMKDIIKINQPNQIFEDIPINEQSKAKHIQIY